MAAETQPGGGRKLFYGLFVFPLLIAVGMAILLCTVVLLTNEEETPESLITAIKTGSPSKRWQKAFELSNEINRHRTIRNEGVMREVIHILEDPGHYDAKTRSYMAAALAQFDSPEAAEALRRVLGTEESDDVVIYTLWSLGTMKASAAAAEIAPYLNHKNPEVRKIAVYVLGSLGDNETVRLMRPLLKDPAADVQWNAALGLARLGDGSGWEQLTVMLDRGRLTAQHGLADDQIEKIMINAAKGAALLRDPRAVPLLEPVAGNDKSLRVRQAAIDALEYVKGHKNELPVENPAS